MTRPRFDERHVVDPALALLILARVLFAVGARLNRKATP